MFEITLQDNYSWLLLYRTTMTKSSQSKALDQTVTLTTDKYVWTRDSMPHIYEVGDAMEVTDLKTVIGLPLTWETLCVVDAIRAKVPNLMVIPCSSGPNSSLQPGVFKYLEKWGVAHTRTATDQDRLQVLRQKPDVVIDCTFALGGFGIQHGILSPSTIILEDTKTGENLIEEYGIPNPFIILDNSQLKRTYENQEGIGYSVIAALKNMGFYLPRYKVGIIGYGYVGVGLAKYAAASGAEVMICEIDEEGRHKAAKHYTVLDKKALLQQADIVIMATGRKDVITRRDIEGLRKQLVLANAGGDYEWDRQKLFQGVEQRRIHEHVTQSVIGDCVLREVCGGNSVNLAVGISISEFLDITFAHLITVLGQLKKVQLAHGKNSLEMFDAAILTDRLQTIDWLQRVT